MPRLELQQRAGHVLREAQRHARTFFAWWWQELRGLVPTQLADFFVDPLAERVLFVHEDGLIENPARPGADQTDRDRVAPHGDAQIRNILILPREQFLRRKFALPRQAGSEMSGAVHFQIDRQTPFTPDQVQYRYRVSTRNPKSIEVELAVAPDAVVSRALALSEQYGIEPARIEIEGDEGRPRFDFLPKKRRGSWCSWRDEPWKALLVATAFLLVLGPPCVASYLDFEVGKLAFQIAAKRDIGQRAGLSRAQYLNALAAARFLPEQQQTPRTVEVLDTLSQVLPVDSWVYDLEISDKEVEISGLSANVSRMIERLQTVSMFGPPQFRSPVVHGEDNTKDRFDIVLALKAKTQ